MKLTKIFKILTEAPAVGGGAIPSPAPAGPQARAQRGSYGSPEQAQASARAKQMGRTVKGQDVSYRNPKIRQAFDDAQQELNNLIDVATQVRTFLARQDVAGAMNYLPTMTKVASNVGFNLQNISAAQSGGQAIAAEGLVREDHMWNEPDSLEAKIEEKILHKINVLPHHLQEVERFISKGEYKNAYEHLGDIKSMLDECLVRLKEYAQSHK